MAAARSRLYTTGMATQPGGDRLHVFLATDLSPESEAHVAFGARLAERLGARTVLYHAVVWPPAVAQESLLAPPFTPPIDVDAVRKRVQEVASTLRVDRPVHVEVEECGNARTAILAAAERVHADLLILPTHGRSGLQRALLGSTAEDVLRHSRHPVVLLTDRMVHEPQGRDSGGRFVMVPTDLTPEAAAAHAPAADLARRLGLPLLLMSVLPAREAPPMGGGAPVAAVRSDPQVRVEARLKELRQIASRLGGNLHVEVFACVDDDPAKAIVAKATARDTAFVVVATHGRTGLARVFRGSIAEDIVRHATVPVVCVPIAHG